MTKLEIWEMITGVMFLSGAWITISGIALMVISTIGSGSGIPGVK